MQLFSCWQLCDRFGNWLRSNNVPNLMSLVQV